MQIGTDSKLVHKFQKSSLLEACIDTLRNVEKVISISRLFCPRRNLNSVEDYSSSSVAVVCRLSCVCRLSVSNFKNGIISKRFELEG